MNGGVLDSAMSDLFFSARGGKYKYVKGASRCCTSSSVLSLIFSSDEGTINSSLSTFYVCKFNQCFLIASSMPTTHKEQDKVMYTNTYESYILDPYSALSKC